MEGVKWHKPPSFGEDRKPISTIKLLVSTIIQLVSTIILLLSNIIQLVSAIILVVITIILVVSTIIQVSTMIGFGVEGLYRGRGIRVAREAAQIPLFRRALPAAGKPDRFRGGLVFKAHRLLYHSTLSLRVIKKKKNLGLLEKLVLAVGLGLLEVLEILAHPL